MAARAANDPHRIAPLLAGAQQGESAAWNALMTRLRPYLFVLVRRLLMAGSPVRTSDSSLVQETLLHVHSAYQATGPARFQGNTVPQFLAWVGQIARNVVTDAARHDLAQKRATSREVADSRLLAGVVEGRSPDQVALDHEDAVAVAAALECLPHNRREVIALRYFECLPFEEIAEKLQKKPGTIRVTHMRALEQLRAELERRP